MPPAATKFFARFLEMEQKFSSALVVSFVRRSRCEHTLLLKRLCDKLEIRELALIRPLNFCTYDFERSAHNVWLFLLLHLLRNFVKKIPKLQNHTFFQREYSMERFLCMMSTKLFYIIHRYSCVNCKKDYVCKKEVCAGSICWYFFHYSLLVRYPSIFYIIIFIFHYWIN